MIKVTLSLPQLGLIAATRGMLGAGIGLLVGDRLTSEQRRAAGWALLGVGVLTTLPLVVETLSHRSLPPGEAPSGPGFDAVP
ncbi:MAG: hypothetical protein HY319_01475 [Armatimonadetes bacterium]|nr:hypothetical protein [Armatimonadota bacterium]